MIKFVDMFSGIGGFREGLTRAGGFECVGHCEIDKYANRSYNALFDTKGEWFIEDARKADPSTMPDFQLLCGGFPCQTFSIAGSRKGFGDPRGTLFFELARLAEARKPSYLLFENVPGLLSHDGGRTFATILNTLDRLGYGVEWQCLNSKDFGVPQSRNRVYIVGYLDERCRGNGWASIFPIVSIVFVYYIVYMGAVANTSQTTMMGGILYAFILISNICFFLGEVATEKRYLTAEEYKQMMFEQEKTEAVMNLQEQHLKEMKGLIHDFEAQLNGLQLLARENKSEAFKKSIEEVRESIQERNDFYFVESKALQLILNQTNELCIKYGIEFCADIRYGNFLFMTFPDVFSLFENALCNAVNACLQLGEEEKKRIELRVFRQHEQIVVLLANTYNKANTRSNTYALHPHHEHGYGIQNIKRVIRKYNGTYLVKKEDVYKLMISFPLDVGNVKI